MSVIFRIIYFLYSAAALIHPSLFSFPPLLYLSRTLADVRFAELKLLSCNPNGMIAGIRGPSFAVKFPYKGSSGRQDAYHETFDVDDSAPARAFVPVVDELGELWNIMPYKKSVMQRCVTDSLFVFPSFSSQIVSL
jgi:hypothetical protein